MRTVLMVLAALLIVGCGGSTGSSYKPKESDVGANTAREERGPVTPAAAADTAIGETADRGDFEFRVLDVVRDESWRYPETDDAFGSSAPSSAGEFAVVWYAVRNTGDAPLNLGKLGDTSAGVLTADTGESFGISEDAACGPTQNGGIKNLQPRGLQLSCLIFDMPADATPESLEVRFGKGYEPARVDLTTKQPESIEPDETIALQYEFTNAGYFDLAYELFAPSSQQQFTYAQYEDNQRRSARGVNSGYAFPSVTVEGDHATVVRVLTIYDTKTSYKGTARRTQELVRVGGAWRIVARPSRLSTFFRARNPTAGGHSPPSSPATRTPPGRTLPACGRAYFCVCALLIIPEGLDPALRRSWPYRGGAMGFPLLASGSRGERKRRPVRIPIRER